MQRAANFFEKFCIFAVHCIFIVFKTLKGVLSGIIECKR